MKVSLFVTCLVDQLFPAVGICSLRILERLGVEAEFDPRQTCCGQPAFNSGYQEQARECGRQVLEVFASADAVVVPSGSCCSMLREQLPGLFPPDSEEGRMARRIARRSWELSEFLVDVLRVDRTGARFRDAVGYHDSCHLARGLGVRQQPRQLIRNVAEIDFRELDSSDRCCGFGGAFSLQFGQVACALGEDKAESIRRSGVRYVTAADVSCLMHLDGILRRRRVPVKTIHLAELLAKFDD